MVKKKCVIFGAGLYGLKFWAEEMEKAQNTINEIIAFADNDKNKQGKKILDIPILPPEDIVNIEFDDIYIFINDYSEVKDIENQLLSYGIPKEKISVTIFEKKDEERRREQYEIMQQALSMTYFMNAEKDKYEEKWVKLKEQYNRIQLLWLPVGILGEFLPRYFNIYEEKVDENTLRVVIPIVDFIDGICNKAILNMIKEKVYIPENDDLTFWIYIYNNHSNELALEDEKKYLSTQSKGGLTYFKSKYSSEFSIDQDYREQKLREIGIEGDYICFADRERRNIYDTDADHRSYKFDVFKKIIDKLGLQGITGVRMGKDRKEIIIQDNLIDYAGKFYSEEMDVLVISGAKGFVSPLSGINCLAMMFGIPILTVNAVAISHEAGGMRYTDCDIYLPKKYYDTKKERFLSLREMFEFERNIRNYKYYYDAAGIELIDNTEDEIADAVDEFIQRIDGVWQDSYEDTLNYQKYREIYDRESLLSFKAGRGASLPARISTVFLRNNKYLLE